MTTVSHSLPTLVLCSQLDRPRGGHELWSSPTSSSSYLGRADHITQNIMHRAVQQTILTEQHLLQQPSTQIHVHARSMALPSRSRSRLTTVSANNPCSHCPAAEKVVLGALGAIFQSWCCVSSTDRSLIVFSHMYQASAHLSSYVYQAF